MATQRVHPAIGDPKEFVREMEIFRRSTDFANAHYSELLATYPREWIGVYNGEVRGHDADLPRLLAHLDALGVPRRALYTQFLDPKPLPMIL